MVQVDLLTHPPSKKTSTCYFDNTLLSLTHQNIFEGNTNIQILMSQEPLWHLAPEKASRCKKKWHSSWSPTRNCPHDIWICWASWSYVYFALLGFSWSLPAWVEADQSWTKWRTPPSATPRASSWKIKHNRKDICGQMAVGSSCWYDGNGTKTPFQAKTEMKLMIFGVVCRWWECTERPRKSMK